MNNAYFHAHDGSAPPYTFDLHLNSGPQVWIKHDAWLRMQAYVNLCAQEINGFGLVSQLDGGVFLIDEVFITEQTVTRGSADADPADMHKVMFEMIQQGLDFERLRCQWHSHVTGETRFSGTDTTTIERFQAPWWISLVLNQFGHVGCRLDFFEPAGFGLNLPLRVLVPGLTTEELEGLMADMEEKVTVLPDPRTSRRHYGADFSAEDEVPPLFVPYPERALGQLVPVPADTLLTAQR